jgi:hypothetical protein
MLPTWVYVVIALAVVIIIVVVVVMITSNATPNTLKITWVNSDGTTLYYSNRVPQSGVYILSPAEYWTSLNPSILTTLLVQSPGSTVTTLYTITGNYPDVSQFNSTQMAFVKYTETSGASRFAFIMCVDSNTFIVSTVDDVTNMANPTKYTGSWVNSTNGVLSTGKGYILFE